MEDSGKEDVTPKSRKSFSKRKNLDINNTRLITIVTLFTAVFWFAAGRYILSEPDFPEYLEGNASHINRL
jgi:hypothetical protein